MRGTVTNSRHGNRDGKWRSHFLDHKHESESELEVVWVFKLSKPLSSNILPTRLYCLTPKPASTSNWDGQVLDYPHLEGIFSFKSLHPLNTNTLRDLVFKDKIKLHQVTKMGCDPI